MRGKLFCIVLLSFFLSDLFSQSGNTTIELSAINYELIESLYSKKSDALRKEKNCTALSKDNTLKKAGKDQADYMLSKNRISHDQKTKDKETPQKRVFFYGGTHDQVGENCIKIYLKKPTKAKGSKTPVVYNTYEEAAEALFQGWKNSPPHYRNMINPAYDVQGLGFAFLPDSNALYVAQVFSAKPYLPPKGAESPADAYNIAPYLEAPCKCFDSPEGRKAFSVMQLSYGYDSIYMRSEDLKALKQFFTNPKDAIYFDFVLREQFVCDKNNLLHGSPVYDGCMQKPVLFQQLFKNNKAHDGKNMYSAIGKIPEFYRNKKYNINYGLVKNGFACEYIWPHHVPSRDLDILTLFPKWLYEEHVTIKPDTFKGQLSFTFPFERGKTALGEKQQVQVKKKVRIYEPYIKKIGIHTYSSVEGSTELNVKLQEKRAEEIAKLLKEVTARTPDVSIESKENWEEFYRQVDNTGFSFLKELSRDSVKLLLKNKKVLDSLDFLLRKTRAASVVMDVEAIVDNNSSAYLILASYKKAIANGDSLRAFSCQKKILESVFNHQAERPDLLEIELPYSKKFLAIWTNYLALAVTDSESVYSYKAREVALKAIKIDSTYKPLQFNFCILALKYLHLYQDTLIPIKHLEEKMLSCFGMCENKLDTILVNHMMLNYSILSAYRHWMRYEYDKLDRHLLNMKKYYPQAQVTENEAIRLGLVFNLYARYPWTIDISLPYLQNNTRNEDMTFLFVQTCGRSRDFKISDEEWISYIKRARNMNEKRFFDWIDVENFQYLRVPELKKEFCDIKK